MKQLFLITLFIISAWFTQAQNANDVLNLMIENKLISAGQADSVRADAAIKQRQADAAKKSFLVTAARQIQINGYTQFRYQNLDEPGKIDGFDIRRARLDIKGSISPLWAYRLQVEFAGGPKVLDAYGEFKPKDYLNIIFGQSKIPFSMENLTGSNKLECIDRSQVVEAMVARGKDIIGNQNGRDAGVTVYGSFLKVNEKYLFEYRLGVFNGYGINVGDKNEAKDFIGRIVAHPVNGLDIGGSYLNGYANFADPNKPGQVRKRLGFELSYTVGNFNMKSEYIEGMDGDIHRGGWYAQAGYFIIPAKFQVLGKYDTYDTDMDVSDNISTIYSIVFTYNFNNWTRLQAAYSFRDEQGEEINNNNGSIQFQIGF